MFQHNVFALHEDLGVGWNYNRRTCMYPAVFCWLLCYVELMSTDHYAEPADDRRIGYMCAQQL